MFYLSNDKSNRKSLFTTKSVATRCLKLDPILICFDDIFFELKVTNPTNVFTKGKYKSYQTQNYIDFSFDIFVRLESLARFFDTFKCAGEPLAKSVACIH